MVHIDTRGAFVYATLDAPATRNALTDAMVAGLADAMRLAASMPAVRALVIRGAGGSFCAGGDFGGFRAAMATEAPRTGPDPIATGNRRFGALLAQLRALPVASIAVVDGAAIGGGCGLAAACDVVLAAADARFAMPEVTLGLPPAQIAPFVASRIGVARTRRLSLTAHRFDGREAERIGLVDQACPDTAALEAALSDVLAGIARCAPGANAVTKRLILASRLLPREELLDQSADAFAACLRGDEGREGVTAFREKRKAKWAQ